MSIRNLHILIIVCVAYVVAQMLADITFLRKLVIVGISITAFDLVYPLTFSLRDMAHKLAGANVARTLIVTSAVIYVLAQFFFWFISNVPPEMTADERTALDALQSTDWRFLLAAVVATIVSQLADTEIYSWWMKRFGDERQWGRVLLSNVIGIPLDRILFLLLAFAFSKSLDDMWGMFIGVTVVRLAIGIISVPGIYLVEEHSQDWVKLAKIG